MSGKALWNGLKTYAASLVATILFPLLWLQALRLARAHAEADSRGRLKVLAAIAISMGIAAVGAFAVLSLQTTATSGIYESLDGRMATTLGESEYQTNLEVVGKKPETIATIEANLAAARADGNDTTQLEAALASAQAELANAQRRVQELAPNHALYVQVSAALSNQDDAGAKALVAGSTLAEPKNIPANTQAAFAVKDQSVADLRGWLLFFVWPSVVGAFYAPLAFALGSILKAAFVPSDTVGFKPYPGAAAGFFLLFGAFGLPSIPFAAWTFLDAHQRSKEGQIAL